MRDEQPRSSPGGGIGRRAGLKIQFPQGSASSSLAPGTKSSPKTIKLREDGTYLYQQKNSRYWYVRFKDKGRWLSRSTGQEDEFEAAAAGLRIVDEYVPRQKRKSKAFSHWADKMGDRWKEGNRPIYSTYFSVLVNWVQAFFGSQPVNEITQTDILDYYAFLERNLGRTPAKSTINSHNVVLRSIFERAANDKVINRGDIPKLSVKGNGRPNSKRPDFDIKEYRTVLLKLSDYKKKGTTFTTTYKRTLLHYYVAMLFYTGMRPGKEIEKLTWDCIDAFTNGEGKQFVRIWVLKGKRGQRKLIASSPLRLYLGKLLNLIEGVGGPTAPFREWTQKDSQNHSGELVFSMPDGSPFKGASEMFKKFLIEYGLYRNPHGDGRALYS